MQRVAVVGASGPLGRAVSRELRASALDVTAVSRSGAEGVARMDATDPPSVRRVLEAATPEAVVYLARPDLRAGGDVWSAVDVAVDAFATFVDSCIDVGVQRLLFASSAAVYGTAEPTPRSETAAVDTGSPYAALKLRSEAVLDSARLMTTSFRIFNVYGPGFDTSLVNRLVTASEPAPVVVNSDSFVRDYIHSADVARLFRRAIESGALPTPVVNVGTGVGTSNRELLALLGVPTVAAALGPALASFSIANPHLLREAWGFAPTIDLRSAIRRPEFFAA